MLSRGGADDRRSDGLRAKLGNSRTFAVVLSAGAGLALIGGSAGVANARPATDVAASSTTATLFGSMKPRTRSVSDRGPAEVGVTFRSSQPGRIVGLRFYKGRGNTGTH